MKAAEVFDQVNDAFDPKKAGNLRAVFQFNLSGPDGGDWFITVADQNCQVDTGIADKADVTVGMDADDFVKMVEGDLQPVVAFMQGRIKLQGNMDLAMKVQELFAGASK
jgi:putative sterol carrier protein